MAGRHAKLKADQLRVVDAWWAVRKVTPKQIAGRLGISTTTLNNACKRLGAYKRDARG